MATVELGRAWACAVLASFILEQPFSGSSPASSVGPFGCVVVAVATVAASK